MANLCNVARLYIKTENKNYSTGGEAQLCTVP